jgi:signal transduction histidine kinase
VVWVGVPEPVILAPVHTMVRRLLLMALGILLLGAGIAWIASTRIVMPLRQLTRAAEGIAAGDYTVRVPTERTDELGRLATSFNSMAAQVDDGRRTLEARVEERTAELSDALERLHSAQEELVRKEKLALLGQLAGGVGHELRNPLGVMTNAVHYLGLVLPDAPPTVHEYLGILRTQIGLAERIVGDLLDSARVKSPEREPVAIGPLLTEQLGRVGRPDDVRVAFDIAPDVPHAYVDRVQIGQVLVNLITNGVQAMAGRGGTLTLRANRDGGRQVRVDVIDTGPGIADEHLAKIFEPLFTTKARGIGLGLAVARTLALANGGTLTVTSQPGMGATFRLLLPTVAAEGA